MAFDFILNGKVTRVEGLAPTTTLLDYLRTHGATGSKQGCAEGVHQRVIQCVQLSRAVQRDQRNAAVGVGEDLVGHRRGLCSVPVTRPRSCDP